MIIKPISGVYIDPIYNEKSNVIDRVKQDNIDYRGIPDERIRVATHKTNDLYYVDETKLKDYINGYNTPVRLLDIYA